MKLHRITLENLNSLYGHHTIDLDDELAGTALFLIVGPTGAGKSTILDAVSLALFGCTPRLSRAHGESDKDPRDIMSVGTGRCLAELEFSVVGRDQVRRRYRAEWSCHRARQQPDGNKQPEKRALYRLHDDGTEEHLTPSASLREVQAACDAVLGGLTVEDFQRSVLLPQGEFASFLKATEKDRAAILERLTDTSIYRQLGAHAADRCREARQATEQIEARMEGVTLLTDAEVADREAQLGAAQEAARERRVAHASAVAQRDWVQRMGELDGLLASARASLGTDRAAWDAAAAERAQLDEDARCRPALGAIGARDHASAAATRLAAGLAEEATTLSALTVQEAQHAEKVALTKRAYADAERALDGRRPELERARAARAALARAVAEEEQAAQRLQDARARRKHAEGERLLKEETLAQQQARRDEARTVLDALAAAAELPEALAGFEARRESIERQARQARTLGDQATRLRSDMAEADQATAHHAAALEPRRVVLSTAAIAKTDAEATLQALLAGAESVASKREALRHEASALADQRRGLVELRAELNALSEAVGALEVSRVEALRLADARVGSAQAMQEAERMHGRACEAHLASTREVETLTVRQRFAEARALLRPEEACPVCGSVEHPYAGTPDHPVEAGVDELLAAALAEREARAQAVAAAQQRLERSRVEAAGMDRELAAIERRIATQASVVDSRTTAATMRRSALGLGPLTSLDDLAAAEATLSAGSEALSLQMGALDTACDARSRAHEAWSAANAALSEATTQLAASSARAGHLAANLTDTVDQLAALQAEHAEAADALANAMTSHGVEVPREGGNRDLAAGLMEAHRLVKQLRQARTSHLSAEKAIDEAVAAHALADAELRASVETYGRTKSEHSAHVAAVEEARAAVSGLLDGADPDVVEGTLTAARVEAEKAWATAQTAHQSCKESLAAAVARHHALDVQRVEAQATLERASSQLAAVLAALELGEAEVVARTLEASRREALQTRRADQIAALQLAQGRHDAVEAQHAAHAATRPDALAPEATPLALDDTVRALADQVRAQNEAVGDLRRQLQVHADNLSAVAELAAHLQRAQAELAVWDELRKLIGIGNGEVFQRFAQSLNLGNLLDAANAWLAQLANRYQLAQRRTDTGVPTLQFEVVDRDLASSRRSLSTLSGGETFLVSLAMSLALANTRQVQMPIETLLLDEGFGTLDPDTLSTAMEALETLQATGTQVGVISHVEALRERIPAQIVVEPVSSERSIVRVAAP